ncbi:MAG: hypothetical protein ABIQ86_12865 [Steroidobacteraceae bacterium]
MNWISGTFTITCDPAKQDASVIAAFLATSYWAKGIPKATVEESLKHSLCFALLDGDRQVGFARVISDYATIAFLNDVFILCVFRLMPGHSSGPWRAGIPVYAGPPFRRMPGRFE